MPYTLADESRPFYAIPYQFFHYYQVIPGSSSFAQKWNYFVYVVSGLA